MPRLSSGGFAAQGFSVRFRLASFAPLRPRAFLIAPLSCRTSSHTLLGRKQAGIPAFCFLAGFARFCNKSTLFRTGECTAAITQVMILWHKYAFDPVLQHCGENSEQGLEYPSSAGRNHLCNWIVQKSDYVSPREKAS